MSVRATTAGGTTSGNTTSSTTGSASTASTATGVSPVPGSVAIFGVLDGVLMLFLLLAVNGTPLFGLTFKRGNSVKRNDRGAVSGRPSLIRVAATSSSPFTSASRLERSEEGEKKGELSVSRV